MSYNELRLQIVIVASAFQFSVASSFLHCYVKMQGYCFLVWNPHAVIGRFGFQPNVVK